MKRPLDSAVYAWSWNDCVAEVRTLASLMQHAIAGRQFALYGVPRGGLVFALMLAHELGREGELAVQSTGQGVIVPRGTEVAVVVDDVCETGQTFANVRERFGEKCPVICASIVTKKRAEFDADVSVMVLADNIWVQFPWEKKDADAPEVDQTDVVGEDEGAA